MPPASCTDDASPQHWLGVNFASCFDDGGMAALGRPPLDLVFVVDISGSMSCSFDNDTTGGGSWGSSWNVDDSKSKLGVAKRCALCPLEATP